jgi:hypothetical protein
LLENGEFGLAMIEDVEGTLANRDVENSQYAIATRRQPITPRPCDDPDYVATLPERWKTFNELFTRLANEAGQLS